MMKSKPLFLLLLPVTIALGPFPASATDRTWSGGATLDSLWSSVDNWGGTAPLPGDLLFFGGVTRLTPINDLPADAAFGGISFNSGAGAFSLSGNRLLLTGDVVNGSSQLQTIGLGMILDALRTVDTGASGLTLSGALTGPGGLLKAGAGTLLLSGAGANTFDGYTDVTAGQLTLGKTGGVTAVSGDLTLSGAGTAVVFAAGGSQNQIANSATVTLAGAGSVLDNTAANFGLVVGATGVTETIANLDVSDGMFFTGTGTWTISGSGEFDGSAGDARYLHNSGGTVNFGSLSLTGMTGAASGAADTFVVLGNSVDLRSTVAVGVGGLSLNNSRLILSLGSSANTLGSRLVLNGNVSTSGTAASFIQQGGGTLGAALVELSGTAGSHTRTFNVAGGGADLTVSAAITNGAATTGGIIKEGDGTLVLSGPAANTYTGQTTVSGGVLSLGKTGGVNAIGGDLVISGTGDVIFGANGVQNQIPDTAKVTLSSAVSTFNGSGPNSGTVRPVTETIGSIEVTNGSFNTGAGSIWTVTGTGVFDGAGAAQVIFVGNSGSIAHFGGLSLTGMTNASIVGVDSFVMGGASTAIASTLTVGTGGLTLNGSVLGLNRGGSETQLGSRLVLNGDVTTTGTTASSIVTSGGFNKGDVELSDTAGDHTRLFTVGGGGANLSVNVAITNGVATRGGITKEGAGILTLSGLNTYTGDTTVNEGTLAIGASDRISDLSHLRVGGTGSFSLGANRNETVAAVTVTATAGGITGTGSSTLTGTSYTVNNASGTATIDVSLGGGGPLDKSGAGTLLLSGGTANTFSGATEVSAGILRLGKTGGVNALAGDLEISGTGDLTFSAGGAQDQIANTAHVSVNGTGGQTGSTFNGSEANLDWQSGIIETIGSISVLNGNFNTGPASTWTIAGEGRFDGTGSADARFIGNSASTTHFGTLRLIAMTGQTLVSSPDSFSLGGSNPSTVTTVSVGAGGLILDGSFIGLNVGGGGTQQGSRLILNGDVTTVGTTASTIARNNAPGAPSGISDLQLSGTSGIHDRTFEIGGGGADLTIGVAITNGAATHGGIIKEGPGTLILTGANTYTGATRIEEGSLIVNGDQSGAGGAITVSAGATLAGEGTLGGATTVSGNLHAGASTAAGAIGSLDFNGENLSFADGSTWFIDLVGAVGDTLGDIGVLGIDPGATLSFHFSNPTETSYTLATYSSRLDGSTFSGFDEGAIVSGYQIHYGSNAITLTAIPEPGTLALLGSGLVGFFLRRNRRRRG